MVSQPATSSRARLLAAAAREFADRGYAGARVDRIAAEAGLTKAMVYYHFAGKTALYRAILVDVFQALADGVAAPPAAANRDPAARLRGFIRSLAAGTITKPHFPAIWLREVADGGRHLDATVARELARTLQVLVSILEAGRKDGKFRPTHPLVVQMSIVAPLLLFQASANARARLGRLLPGGGPVDRAAFIAHIEATALAAVQAAGPATVRSTKEKRR